MTKLNGEKHSTINPGDLRNHAVLVRLGTSKFGILRKDHEATAQIAEEHGADADMVTANKYIINPNHPAFKAIKKNLGAASNKFRDMAGPWDNQPGGYWIITTKGLPTLQAAMLEFEKTHNQLVNDFIDQLPEIIDDAKRKLGGKNAKGHSFFDAAMIPSPNELRNKFGFRMDIEILPDSGNIVLDLDAKRSKAIAKAATATNDARYQALAEYTHTKVQGELTAMAKNMREFGDDIEGSKRGRSFKDGLVDRMTALSNLLPALNITGDPRLDALGVEIAKTLANETGDELRGNRVAGDQRTKEIREANALSAREKAGDSAEKLLGDIDSVFG